MLRDLVFGVVMRVLRPRRGRSHETVGTGMDLRQLSWTCMVCGDERPDAAISVAHRPLRQMPERFPEVQVNVRYCNDRAACVSFAHADGPWQGMSRDEAQQR
jgi:hypothetical protein